NCASRSKTFVAIRKARPLGRAFFVTRSEQTRVAVRCSIMRLLALLMSYLGVTAGLLAGVVAGALWLVRPDPGAATAAPRAAPISPRIADSIERRKMDMAAQPSEPRVEPEPIKPAMGEAPAVLTQPPHRVQIRELSQGMVKRKPARNLPGIASQSVATQEAAATPAPPVARPIATGRTDSPYCRAGTPARILTFIERTCAGAARSAAPWAHDQQQGERAMPVFILWAVPAVVILGGGAYWLMHIH